jgi:hypothetical protein
MPVGALGYARGFCGQNRPCGGCGVGGVALLDALARAPPPRLRALHLKYLDSLGPQVAGETGPVAARTFYPRAPEGAEAFRPAQELFVTLGGRRRHEGLGPIVCPDGPRSRPRGSLGACPHPGLAGSRCPASRRRSSSCQKAPFGVAVASARGAGEDGRYCEGSPKRRAPMRSRRCLGPGRPAGDAKASGRRVSCKAPSARVEGGSGRSEASPTAILQDTHSVEGLFYEVRHEMVHLEDALRRRRLAS